MGRLPGFAALKSIDYESYQELDGSYPFASLKSEQLCAQLLYYKLF